MITPPQDDESARAIAARLREQVLEPMKRAFVGKDTIIDLFGISLVARENLFLLGPPGTAKSALVRDLANRLKGNVFDYLLTRFTEPNEIFGPFDIRKLRDGELVTNTEGMLPEADIIFFDELLNANSAILNSLLMVLNERIFRRGRETRPIPALMMVGACNRLPEDSTLGALFDRFLLRVHCENVAAEQLSDVLVAGWELDDASRYTHATLPIPDLVAMQSQLTRVDVTMVRSNYVQLIQRLRHAGVSISDRRAVKLQRVLAASAILCDRSIVNVTDFWVLRHIWDHEEQQELLATLVDGFIAQASVEEKAVSHPRASGEQVPDPEQIARDLERIQRRVESGDVPVTDVGFLTDHIGVLVSRCQWITEAQPREYLVAEANRLLGQLRGLS